MVATALCGWPTGETPTEEVTCVHLPHLSLCCPGGHSSAPSVHPHPNTRAPTSLYAHGPALDITVAPRWKAEPPGQPPGICTTNSFSTDTSDNFRKANPRPLKNQLQKPDCGQAEPSPMLPVHVSSSIHVGAYPCPLSPHQLFHPRPLSPPQLRPLWPRPPLGSLHAWQSILKGPSETSNTPGQATQARA